MTTLNWPEAETVMESRTEDDSEPIDRKTSQSICEAVAERLHESLRPEPPRLSSHLQHLVDELCQRDEAGGPKPN